MVSGTLTNLQLKVSYKRLTLINNKVIRKYGGALGVSDKKALKALNFAIETESQYGQLDKIETISLAVYFIIKGHYFLDGNKRTAYMILLILLKDIDVKYTGRHLDLVRKIEEMAKTKSSEKQNKIKELSYFLKSKLQKK